MKKFSFFLLLYLCQLDSVLAQDVRRLSELSPSDPGSMMYYLNGQPYTGEAIDFYGEKVDKTNMKFDGHYVQGQPNGHIRQWYPNNKLEYDENYSSGGVKDGIQRYYYDNGKSSDISSFKKGQLDGKQTKWYSNGKKTSEKMYANGMTVGKWTSYDEKEQLISEEEYQQGEIIHKILTSWHPNGKKSSEKIYAGDVPSGKWTTYDEKGQLESGTTYQNGKIASEEFFKDNVPDGIWTTTEGSITKKTVYLNGKKKSESRYSGSTPVATQLEYMEDGQIKETTYSFSGEKTSEGIRINNKKEGKWTSWSNSGEIRTEETYKDDVIQATVTKVLSHTVGFHHANSYLFKLSDNKTFIRFDFIYPASTVNTNKVTQVVKDNLMHSDRLIAIEPDGPYKDEDISYIIELTNITVNFAGITTRSVSNPNITHNGYSSRVEVALSLKNKDNVLIDSKTYTGTSLSTAAVLLAMAIAYDTEAQALDAANRTDYVKKFITKNFPVKK